jgi:ADP-ribose pyrophosphatase YjhB (NUDIX family)
MFETKEGTIKPIVYVGIVNKGKLLLVDYKQAPNPSKSGWWIPAPGLEFGEDPLEKAQKVCEEFGINADDIKLHDVESFVLPGGWHFICHYVINTDAEPKTHPNVKSYRWVTAGELTEMKDIAHGKWEIGVGKGYLQEK